MKIALVCPYDWSRPGGVRDHVVNLADQLSGDHDVRIFAPASAPVEDARVVAVGSARPIRFNRSIAPVALSPLSARRLLQGLADFDPHITHIHEPLAPVPSAAAGAFGRGPLVGTFHTWSDRRLAYSAVAPLGRRVANRLAMRIAVSPAAQEYAAGALKLPLGAFRIVPNGVDVPRFAGAEPLPQLVDPERPLILFVGRLEPRKGLEVLLRGFLRLRVTMPSARLCVVGEGPERERCQELIPASIRPDVLFVGRVAHDELPRYHASADVFVSPATGGESFGIVLLEAMAAGLPVIASDIPGYRTVLKDGRQGRMVRPGDGVALATALEALLANPRLRKAMGEEGRETAARYAWPVVAAQVTELYREVHRST